MDPIKLDCTFEERVSKKDPSKTYKGVFLKISNNYTKYVELTYPEKLMLESTYSTSTKHDNSPFEY